MVLNKKTWSGLPNIVFFPLQSDYFAKMFFPLQRDVWGKWWEKAIFLIIIVLDSHHCYQSRNFLTAKWPGWPGSAMDRGLWWLGLPIHLNEKFSREQFVIILGFLGIPHGIKTIQLCCYSESTWLESYILLHLLAFSNGDGFFVAAIRRNWSFLLWLTAS